MFETAELGQKVRRKEYEERVTALRLALVDAQLRVRKAGFPVIVVFAGVDAAGKSETANLISSWMDPRKIVTRAYGRPSDEESERPPFWRYWRDLPPSGHIGIFLSAWYNRPLIRRAYEKSTAAEFSAELSSVTRFEKMLADDGALILKFWMHLSRRNQRARLKELEGDPLQRWRVTKRDWKHWKMYDTFVDAAKRLITATSSARAPWKIVEGLDSRFRTLSVGTTMLEAMENRLDRAAAEGETPAGSAAPTPALGFTAQAANVLDTLEPPVPVSKKDYARKLERWQGRLNLLQREARERRVSTVLVFEGWDAAGKGGAIRRVTAALDARDYEVFSIAAPSDEERSHHYLWRFWRRLPRGGRVAVFDRSWYGRVLVERVEGLASEAEWKRAYAEINEFEARLVSHGIVLVKFWLHISSDEQKARFEARAEIPHKRWKLTDEDWRNREKWGLYAGAVHEMVERTSSAAAPWTPVEANDKRCARIEVLRTVCNSLGGRLA
jgi:polyphosphate:AMP phosphotransferase